MLLANLSRTTPIDINAVEERAPAAGARRPFEDFLGLDTSLLTHDEIDRLRPRVYELLAGGLAAPEAGRVAFSMVHDAYRATAAGEPLLAGRGGAEGAILIVRDPRDVAASLANHYRTSIDAAIAHMNNPARETHTRPGEMQRLFRHGLRSWSGHAQSWLDQADLPICVVRYEDLKADAAGTFARALAFAGEPADAAAIGRAVAFSDFEALRRQEQASGFARAPQTPGGPFFRRGQAGGWRDELTAGQVARLEAAHAAAMRRLGYQPVTASAPATS
jgi:hypothetical protein